jgi:hypothetical protein
MLGEDDHYPPCCAFVNAITKCTPLQHGDASALDPHLVHIAKMWRLYDDAWTDASRFEGDELRYSARYVRGPLHVEVGEDPAGSWHQINNGGPGWMRKWAAVSGVCGDGGALETATEAPPGTDGFQSSGTAGTSP